jgi:hypothetical protein
VCDLVALMDWRERVRALEVQVAPEFPRIIETRRATLHAASTRRRPASATVDATGDIHALC